jgi:hypothetical protein
LKRWGIGGSWKKKHKKSQGVGEHAEKEEGERGEGDVG